MLTTESFLTGTLSDLLLFRGFESLISVDARPRGGSSNVCCLLKLFSISKLRLLNFLLLLLPYLLSGDEVLSILRFAFFIFYVEF